MYCAHAVVSDSLQLNRRQWHPTPVLLPGKSHGQRSLEDTEEPGGIQSAATAAKSF